MSRRFKTFFSACLQICYSLWLTIFRFLFSWVCLLVQCLLLRHVRFSSLDSNKSTYRRRKWKRISVAISLFLDLQLFAFNSCWTKYIYNIFPYYLCLWLNAKEMKNKLNSHQKKNKFICTYKRKFIFIWQNLCIFAFVRAKKKTNVAWNRRFLFIGIFGCNEKL